MTHDSQDVIDDLKIVLHAHAEEIAALFNAPMHITLLVRHPQDNSKSVLMTDEKDFWRAAESMHALYFKHDQSMGAS